MARSLPPEESASATSSSTAGNKIFYTGGKLAQSNALKFADESGFKIIDNTNIGRGLTWLTNKTSYSFTKPLWNGASYLYAMGTENAYIFMDVSKMNSGSIFFRTELPRLEYEGASLNFKVVDKISNFSVLPIY
jgi:hypothetical protein